MTDYCDICGQLFKVDKDDPQPICYLCAEELKDEEFDNWLNESW